MSSTRLTRFILIGLVLGIIAGYVAFDAFPEGRAEFASMIGLLPTMFLRLIKMIIAPLVISTLVVGIAKMGDITTVGRVGGKALAWFIFASLLSLTLGLLLVGFFEPGKVMQLPIPAGQATSGISTEGLSLESLITHAIPTSIVQAMTNNEILQIVVFSLFF